MGTFYDLQQEADYGFNFGGVSIYDLGACVNAAFNRTLHSFGRNSIFDLSGMAWAAIAYTAIVCWVLPYYLWLEGLKHLSASTSSVLLLSEIVVAVVASVAVLKEPVTVFSTIGAFFIIIAISLVSVRDKQLARERKPED